MVEQKRIVDLPLNGRNAATLALLVPGAIQAPANNADQGVYKTFPVAVTVSANGSRTNQTSFNMDGMSNNDVYTNVNQPLPFPDALQEFSVQTSNYSSKDGGNSGASVNIVTKSGTNELHGDAFEFVRNAVFNARNFFAGSRDQLKRIRASEVGRLWQCGEGGVQRAGPSESGLRSYEGHSLAGRAISATVPRRVLQCYEPREFQQSEFDCHLGGFRHHHGCERSEDWATGAEIDFLKEAGMRDRIDIVPLSIGDHAFDGAKPYRCWGFSRSIFARTDSLFVQCANRLNRTMSSGLLPLVG